MSERDLEPLDADLEDLLAQERQRPAAAARVRERVLSRVHATLGLGGPGGGGDGAGPRSPEGADPAAPEPPAVEPPAVDLPAAGAEIGRVAAGGAASGSLLGGLLPKPLLILGFAALALGSGAIVGIRRSAPPSPPPSAHVEGPRPGPADSAAAEPPLPAPAPEAAGPAPEAVPASPASAAPIAPRASAAADPARAGRDADLAAERAILEEAHRAVAGGRSGAALEALHRHAREFPRGRLSEEREGLWIQALVGAGRTDEARERAGRFRRRYPGSMLLPALESALGTIP